MGQPIFFATYFSDEHFGYRNQLLAMLNRVRDPLGLFKYHYHANTILTPYENGKTMAKQWQNNGETMEKPILGISPGHKRFGYNRHFEIL